MSQPEASSIPMLPLVPPHDQVVPASTARRDMKNGDILLWHGDYWVSKMFERVTGSRYSHAAIASRWDGELILMQAEALGIQAVPLMAAVKRYPGLVDWYRLSPKGFGTLTQPGGMDLVVRSARQYLGLKYGYVEVFRSLVYRLALRRLGFPAPHDPKHPHAMFCSEYVATAFKAGGIVFADDSIDTMPDDIVGSDLVMKIGHIKADPDGLAVDAGAQHPAVSGVPTVAGGQAEPPPPVGN
jgi:hypothetical protein